jgi:hypothetical protein
MGIIDKFRKKREELEVRQIKRQQQQTNKVNEKLLKARAERIRMRKQDDLRSALKKEKDRVSVLKQKRKESSPLYQFSQKVRERNKARLESQPKTSSIYSSTSNTSNGSDHFLSGFDNKKKKRGNY